MPTVPSGYTIVTDDLVQFWFSSQEIQINNSDEYRDGYLDLEPADANTDPLIVRGETYNLIAGATFARHVPGLVPSLHGRLREAPRPA